MHGDAVLYLQGEEPGHCMAIQHVLHVGDSRPVLDEYTAERMLGGTNRLELHNTFEDSLLASPSRRPWSRCQTMPARDLLHRCQPRATELPTGAAARLGFLLQAQLGRWGSPVANPLFRQHPLY